MFPPILCSIYLGSFPLSHIFLPTSCFFKPPPLLPHSLHSSLPRVLTTSLLFLLLLLCRENKSLEHKWTFEGHQLGIISVTTDPQGQGGSDNQYNIFIIDIVCIWSSAYCGMGVWCVCLIPIPFFQIILFN